MAELLILLGIVAGVAFLMYNWKNFTVKFKKVKSNGGNKGRTIVVDRTPVDTSKEDELRDRFGDLD